MIMAMVDGVDVGTMVVMDMPGKKVIVPTLIVLGT